MKYKIPFIKPNFPDTEHIIADYIQTVESNWFTNFGPFEQKLSATTAKYIGDQAHATTISNCTLGLEASIELLFDRKKKKALVPSFTFAAGPSALIRAGFTPVFIDIERDSWQPSINQASELLADSSADYAGILLCNIFGVGNQSIAAWEKLAKKYKIPLIIDTAAGFGSRYDKNEKVGLRGDCEVFSFHATKPFAVGEGGLVVSRDEEFIRKVRSWQNFGFEQDRNVHRIGTNAKMQEINAAVGLRQLKGYETRLSERRKSLKKYKELLAGKGFTFQQNDELSTIAFVSILTSSASIANKTFDRLHEHSVEARRYYTPLHQQPTLLALSEAPLSLDVTEDVASRIISLPLHDYMSEEYIRYVTDVLINDNKKNLI